MITDFDNNLKTRNKAYVNKYGVTIMEYKTADTIMLDLPIILTLNKMLTKNNYYQIVYSYMDEPYIENVQLLDFWGEGHAVWLKIRNFNKNVIQLHAISLNTSDSERSILILSLNYLKTILDSALDFRYVDKVNVIDKSNR